MTVGYIGETIPAKVVRTSHTTLFHVAAQQTGDPMQWVAIAELNGITDPWIIVLTTLLIPPVLPSGAQSGILESVRSGIRPSDIAVVSSPAAPVGPGSAGGPSLDFSDPQNTQYLL